MAGGIEFWLISGKDKLRLPVNPESNAYSSPFGYEDVEVEGLGEVTIVKRRGLKEFEISTFWPRDYNTTYCSYSRFITPTAFVKKIESWRSKREPIRYVVTGAGGVNLSVTIRGFEIEPERAGSPGDIYFTLSLKEWREATVKKVDTSKKKKTPDKKRPSPSSSTKVKSYTVKKDESLWKISARKEVYGDGSKWNKIYNANKSKIGKNPNKLTAGMKLVIPR